MRSSSQPATIGDGRTGSPFVEAEESVLLDMAGICKDFSGGRVLGDVHFSLAKGEVHALLGANGAGKSTLMKVLAGVYPDYDGSIRLLGQEVRMRSPRVALSHGIAVIYQEFALAPDLTVAENIALGREDSATALGGLSHRRLEERSAAEAQAIGIRLPMNARVHNLGVAEQQLTEIVKAVARKAKVLVMDEPTARLSGKERTRLFELIGQLAGQGVGIVYVSHFLEEVFEVANRVTVLRDGHNVATRPLSELDIARITKLMVGDTFKSVARGNRSQRRPQIPDDAPPRMTLSGLAVRDVVAPTDLVLRHGEIIGLVGLEGSGRTHLARAIVGCEQGVRGTISVDGFTGLIKSPFEAADKGLVMLPADRKAQGMLMVRSVSENIEVTALRRRLSKFGAYRRTLARAVVNKMMQMLRLQPNDPTVIVQALSGGNQQKVALARAFAAEASVLILDQPTAGVDVGAKADLYDHLDQFVHDGGSALVISDDLDELFRLADRFVLMHQGTASQVRPLIEYDRVQLLEAINTGRLSSIG